MTLIRKDKIYRMFNLPKLKANYFLCNGKKGYTGSLIKRSVKGTIGIYEHSGFIYGFDENNTLWVIENNINGIECITLNDFAQGKRYAIELNTNPMMIETIMDRAHERVNVPYHSSENNCETFTNYCLKGIIHSYQVERTRNFVDVLLTVSEVYVASASPITSTLDDLAKLRKALKVERHESVDKLLIDILAKRTTLGPSNGVEKPEEVTPTKKRKSKTKGEESRK